MCVYVYVSCMSVYAGVYVNVYSVRVYVDEYVCM